MGMARYGCTSSCATVQTNVSPSGKSSRATFDMRLSVSKRDHYTIRSHSKPLRKAQYGGVTAMKTGVYSTGVSGVYSTGVTYYAAQDEGALAQLLLGQCSPFFQD